MTRLFLLFSLTACVGDKTDDSADDSTDDSTDDSGALVPSHEGEGPAGLVTIENTCAPTDGQAVEFKIGLESASCGAAWASSASLRIDIDGGWSGVPLGTYTAWGVWYDPDGDGVFAEGASGSIVIDRVEGDLHRGSYRVEALGDVLEGSFVALHCYGDPLCG